MLAIGQGLKWINQDMIKGRLFSLFIETCYILRCELFICNHLKKPTHCLYKFFIQKARITIRKENARSAENCRAI